MPRGRVEWLDPRAGRGAIAHLGRSIPVEMDEIEPRARVPGAPVRFEVERGPEGRRAVRVTLREGTRVSRRQRRFGDLGGAKSEAEKEPLQNRPPGDRKARKRARPEDG